MRAVRIRAAILSALPVENRTHNFAIVDYVFDALITLLGAFANLLDQSVSLFRMIVEIGIDVDCSNNSIFGEMVALLIMP